MLLGFKTHLKINNKQRTLLAQHAGVARDAYNWGLGLIKEILNHNQVNPNDQLKFPTAIELHKWLVGIRKVEKPWYYQVSKCAPQYALRQLRLAWDRCFKKISGVPKFKKKGKHDSFTLDGSIKIVGSNKIKVPIIGILKTYEAIPQSTARQLLQVGFAAQRTASIKSVTISRQADRWFISFKIETDIQTTNNNSIVGADLGVKSLCTLSTGEVIEGAKSYRQAQKRLAKLQREVSRKVKGSSNRKKAITLLAKVHARVSNIRKDTLHKLTSNLSKNHAVIGIENLNVSGMMSNHCLAKSVADMGFYEFRRQLEYKCQRYGSQLIIVDRWFPSSKICSNCGYKKESLSLSERTFNCDQCNFSLDRDWNASINLRNAASSVVEPVRSWALPK